MSQSWNRLLEAQESSADDDKDKLELYRIIMMSVVGVVSLVIFLPFCVCCRRKKGVQENEDDFQTFTVKNRCIQFMNCFAGGVLVSLTLCHILPEAQDEYTAYLLKNQKANLLSEKFPFVFALVIGGFLLMLSLDQVIWKPNDLFLVEADEIEEIEKMEKEASQEKGEKKAEPKISEEQLDKDENAENGEQEANNEEGEKEEQEGGENELVEENGKDITDNGQVENGQIELQIEDDGQMNTERPLQEKEERRTSEVKRKNDMGPAEEKKNCCTSNYQPALQIVTTQSLLLFALAAILHGFIHGMAIGSFTDVKNIIMVLIIVVVYKIVVALAVGVPFLSAGRQICDPVTILFGLLFVLSTPGGILLVMLLEKDVSALDLEITLASVQSVICGIFVYISCSNLISKEFQSSDDISKEDPREWSEINKHQKCISLVKLLFVLLGFVLVVVLFTFGGQDLTNLDPVLKDLIEARR